MQLKLSTYYSICIVLYLSKKNNYVSIEELSKYLNIETYYVIKFSKKLINANILTIDNKTKSKFSLSKDPKKITILDMINILEGSSRINICLDDDLYKNFYIDKCPIKKFYSNLQNTITYTLENKTIYDLLKD